MEGVVLLCVLIISIFTDIKSRKILNIVTIPTIFLGFVYNIYKFGFDGFLFSGKGFLVGFSLLLIPYLLGGMGAGDVKLMAAIGALMGTNFVFHSFIYTGIFGGLFAVLLILKTRGFKNSVKTFLINIIYFRSSIGSFTIPKDNSNFSFPYGVAIALGTFCTLVWGGF